MTVNATADARLSVKDVSHAYLVGGGRREVLVDIQLDVVANETIGIIGHSGVGKSTLLRLLAGFEKPTTGTVQISEDGVWADVEPSVRIGYLFQQPNLFSWLTVEQNVEFGAKQAHVYPNRTTLHEAAARYLDSVKLSDARTLFPYQISGGMRARTALARVFLTQPDVLLMDEPFGALDALTRREMYLLLRELISRSGGLTTVLITHDVDEAITLCNRIAIMSGSPGGISAVFHTDLCTLDEDGTTLQQEPEYVALRAALLEALEVETTYRQSHSSERVPDREMKTAS